MSGLAVAHHLETAGVPFVLFEAARAPGGVMRTEHVDGLPLDVGPQRTRMTREVRELVEAAGLEDELVFADEELPLYVYRNGQLRPVPFSVGQAVGTDLLSWTGKLRILLEPLTSGLDPDETVADFFIRKFGREAYENMIGPLYGGLYASDPARMYARHGLSITLDHFGVEGSLLWAMIRRGTRARTTVETITFRDGLQRLPERLAERMAGSVRLGSPVTAVEPRPGGGWTLRVGSLPEERGLRDEGHDPLAGLSLAGGPRGAPGGPTPEGRGGSRDETGGGRDETSEDRAGTADTVTVDRLVLSAPAPVCARLLHPHAPEAAVHLDRLNYNPLAVVHLRSECDLAGLGFQVAFGEKLETRGVTWNASMFDRDGVYTVYLGGMKHPAFVHRPDDEIGRTAREEFGRVTGCEAEVLKVSRTHIPAWDGSWDALDEVELPAGVVACANWSARPGIPGRLIQAKRVAGELAAAAGS